MGNRRKKGNGTNGTFVRIGNREVFDAVNENRDDIKELKGSIGDLHTKLDGFMDAQKEDLKEHHVRIKTLEDFKKQAMGVVGILTAGITVGINGLVAIFETLK